ncbi:MAG TPA: deacetylase [Burkholderiales bacterium]|nr:deacetylase [Burkholderiales bacterium]
MSETPFIITIDTEGDDLWSKPREITTRNADFLPRFQALCERFGFKPVYLTNYEMAQSEVFVEFGRDVLARGAGEIGMHLHAWNSPPIVPLTSDDFRFQPYLIEYPDPVMRDKIDVMTRLLEDRFDQAVFSHRAGRLGFDGRYAAMLLEEGYRVDCSVSPGLDWRDTLGDPRGKGGPDYRTFPHRPYFLDPSDIAAPAAGTLLEVPMTIRSSGLHRNAPWIYRMPLLRQTANRMVSPALDHLCPTESRLGGMLRAARGARAEGADHVAFTLHSSELMPGGSPSFPSRNHIARLYEDIEALFGELSRWCRGMTLKEFYAAFVGRRAEARRETNMAIAAGI